MKRVLIFGMVFLMMAFSGCHNQRGKVTENDVKKAEQALFNEDQTTNQEAVANAIETFNKFAKQNPDDPKAPEYLFKALEISINTKQDPVQSILFCENLVEKYPEFDKNPVALFMLASFVYDDQLNDLDMTRDTYQRIVDNYPDSPFARDAAISIQQLGMSPEELIKMFEAQE